MRAAVMQGLHKPLSVETVPDPVPGAGDVIVKVGRCGICGSDLHMTEDPAYGQGAGSILGHEFAGEIVELGKGVEGLSKGDLVAVSPLKSCGTCPSCRDGNVSWCEVFGLQGGGYAEYVLTRPNQCVILPRSASLADGAIIEPLAVALRDAGCIVAVPDLRGHGASKNRAQPGGRDDTLDIRQMRKPDLELIAAGAGGRLREQSAVRGDLETVHAFLASRSGSPPDTLVVVGCGAGATLATLWTATDWAWPPLASGPQGQHVQALVLVSPSWTAKGVSLQPALGTDAIKQEIPVMVLAGTHDRDAIRLFEQLKRQRPKAWFDQRAGAEFTKAKDVEKPGEATLFLMQLDTPLTADKLAADGDTAARIKTFFSLVLDADR